MIPDMEEQAGNPWYPAGQRLSCRGASLPALNACLRAITPLTVVWTRHGFPPGHGCHCPPWQFLPPGMRRAGVPPARFV